MCKLSSHEQNVCLNICPFSTGHHRATFPDRSINRVFDEPTNICHSAPARGTLRNGTRFLLTETLAESLWFVAWGNKVKESKGNFFVLNINVLTVVRIACKCVRLCENRGT
jgi:hypothetical protein